MRKLVLMSGRACKPASALLRDRRGATAAVIALSLTGLAGVGGLATEGASWYFTSRRMQSAADTAAFSGALAKIHSEPLTTYDKEAEWVAANYGFSGTCGASGASVCVNSPPLSGSHTTDPNAVEVIISQAETPLLSSLFMSSGPTITKRSVATASVNSSACVLALDNGNVIDVDDTGNGTLNLNSCSVYINSDDQSGALTMTGNATINASGAYIVGGVSTSGNAALNTNNNTHTYPNVTPLNDPYASVAMPTRSPSTACDFGTTSSSGYSLTGQNSATLSVPLGQTSAQFCNGLSLSGQSSLTLNPGIYIIAGGSLSLSGQTTLNAPSSATAPGGVTIVLTNYNGGSTYATVSISGGANVNVVAPTSGATEGLAFFQDRNAPSTGTDSFTGGSSQSITGAVYLPNNQVSFTGNTGTSGQAVCTQLVALKFNFTGASTFNNNCTGVGTTTFGNSAATYVE
jgi:Flp pilus assembly protein TadG